MSWRPAHDKAHGSFWLPRDRHRPALAILTESADDAISARSLCIEGAREHGAVVASTAGIASAVPAWIENCKPKRTVGACDADSAGDRAARRLRQEAMGRVSGRARSLNAERCE